MTPFRCIFHDSFMNASVVHDNITKTLLEFIHDFKIQLPTSIELEHKVKCASDHRTRDVFNHVANHLAKSANFFETSVNYTDGTMILLVEIKSLESLRRAYNEIKLYL